MPLIGLAVVLAVSLVLAPLVAEGQPTEKGKIPRIGVIWLGTPPAPPPSPTSSLVRFHESLTLLGYVEGQSIEIESRFASDGTGLEQLVEELIRLRVAVIVAMSTPAAIAAKKSTRSIPVVFSIAGDPVLFGLVESLAHPGGNLTGVYLRVSELAAKRLSLLLEVAPKGGRIAILKGSQDQEEINEAQTAARELNVRLVPFQIRTGDEIEPAVRAAKKAGATALSVHTTPQISLNLQRVAELSRTHGLPAIASYSGFAKMGGLLEYHGSLNEAVRRTAAYVDKILNGAHPGDLPVEQPTKFELVINLKTAKALGLTIPQTILLRADQVIE